MDYEKAYKEALERAREWYNKTEPDSYTCIVESIFPELKESKEEQHRKWILEYLYDGLRKSDEQFKEQFKCAIDWLEKLEKQKPTFYHHEADLSNCSEEYRKAYYDGWNNCNMQHSQCKSEEDDVVKCLINGMKFYCEDNKEATWGTEKFSMKVKDILDWLEKQDNKSKQTSIWKHWKGGITGNGDGIPIFLIKNGSTYSLSSCLGFECDYIELSELDNLMF